MAVKLYLLWPEIRDASTSHYEGKDLLRSVDNWNGSDINYCLQQLWKVSDYLHAETDLVTYYDVDNLEELVHWLTNLRDEYPHVEADNLLLLVAQGNALNAVDWIQERVSPPDVSIHAQQCCLGSHILTEACWCSAHNNEPKPILLNAMALSLRDSVIKYQFASDSNEIIRKLECTPVDAVAIIINIGKKRYKQRTYCHNEKHNMPNGYISPTISTRKMLNKMVHVAIGTEENLIWAYDEETNTFSAFRSEDKCTEKIKWHGYTPEEGDERRRNLSLDFLDFLRNIALANK